MYLRFRIIVMLLASGFLGACASTYQLSNQAKTERAGMTEPKAEAILDRFANATDNQGGICLVGIHSPTRLDPNTPVKLSGNKITVAGYFAKVGNVSVSGNVLGDTGQVGVGFSGVRGLVTVDTTQVKELRILPIDTQQKLNVYRTYCPQVKSGYLVVFKSNTGLPDGAELSFNASNQNDLDTIVAALSYLSPDARLVEGVGM